MFFVTALAETNRHPFDLPEAEAELVSGYNVEYSAMGFALFSLGEYANMLLMSAFNVILFFGGWLPPFAFLSFIPGAFWFAIKICFFVISFIIKINPFHSSRIIYVNEEFSLDGDKDVKKPVTVSSTELAKDAYEAEQIKKNAGAALNKKSSNTRPANVKKGYYVVVYAFEYKNNLDRMVRLLTDNGIKVQVIRVADKNLDYVSVAYFTSSAEAHNYMNKTLDKKLFTDSWVYEVE